MGTDGEGVVDGAGPERAGMGGGGLDVSAVECHLGSLLEARGMTVARLSEMVGVSVVNLSILKNNHARAIRFSTLTAICEALGCEIGELLTLRRG